MMKRRYETATNGSNINRTKTNCNYAESNSQEKYSRQIIDIFYTKENDRSTRPDS